MTISAAALKCVLRVAFLCLIPCSAMAGENKHGHDGSSHAKEQSEEHHHNRRYHRHDKHDKHDKNAHHPTVTFQSSDRIIIRDYLAGDYQNHCPPGLAKKHKGCLPPGQAKKHYRVGHTIPRDVVWEPVPQDLLIRLRPPPLGYQYVHVDKDILLISAASHKVVDAITLLSAVGR